MILMNRTIWVGDCEYMIISIYCNEVITMAIIIQKYELNELMK